MGLEEYYLRREGVGVAAFDTPSRDPFATEEATRRFVRSAGPDADCVEFLLEGVTCSACAWLVERVPVADARILRADLNLGRSTVNVVFKRGTRLDQVAGTFRRLGFRVRPGDDPEISRARRADLRLWVLRTGVALACTMATMHVAVSLYAGLLEGISPDIVRELGLALAVVTAPVVFWSAIPFYRGALQALRARRASLDLLVSASVLVGYFTGVWNAWRGTNETYFDAVAMLTGFLLAGRLVTRLAEERVRSGGEFLARELSGEGGGARPGDVVQVSSGETFPGDGFVRAGNGSMNAAWLTGEEEPVPLGPGDRIWAGAVNLDGPLSVEVERTGRDTRMGQILSLVSGAAKGNLQRMSERIEQGIVLGVFGVVATLLAWGAATGHVDGGKIVAVLLVACPCAVGLAVPAVLGLAHRQAAGRRILLKGVDAFERVAEIDTVVFDKTGTLTRAVPRLLEEIWRDPADRKIWGDRVGALALASAHLALRPLRDAFPAPCPDPNSREIRGCGLETSDARGEAVRLGRRDWALGSEGQDEGEWTEIVLSCGKIEVAAFRLSSAIREEAPAAVRSILRGREGWILSGDRPGAVAAVAAACGIASDHALARRDPAEKLRFVEELAHRRKVLFVGDGINDAGALRTAQVGVGVQGGAAAALASCDVYLALDDLGLLVELLDASKAVRRHIGMALAWAVVWNVIGVALVLAGYLGPVVCAFLMPISSLAVVAFALTRRPFGRST
jgi:Cu2+-exporting ATPase